MPSNEDLKVELDEKVEELETELDEKLDENVEEVEDTLVEETAEEETAEEIAEEDDSKFKDDLDALVESEATLSEGFKSKATVIFEAALGSKVKAEVSRLEAEYENALEEAVTSNISEMAEQVDSYLNYVVESWMKENEVAISAGIRADIAESFMKNLKDVFVEHYVEVPEGKTDLVDELAEKLEESKASLDDEISKNIALNESNSELVREKMIRESSTGLSELEIEKFKTLTEEIEYSDEESFKTKLDVLKESYFKSDKVETDLEELNESADTKEVSPVMEKYLAAMRKSK